MKIRAAGLAAVAGCRSVVVRLRPGRSVDAATRAEALQAEGKTVEALDALDGAVDAIWEASPLAFRKVVVVDSSAGYGAYAERADKTFKPDEKLMIYVEPVGFGYGAAGSDEHDRLQGRPRHREHDRPGAGRGQGRLLALRRRARRGSANSRHDALLRRALPAAGRIQGGVHASHDQNSDKTGTFEVPFTIALPTAN